MGSPEHNLRDHIADYLIKVFADAKCPLELHEHDLLRASLYEVLFAEHGLGKVMGDICTYSNPDWQEKRAQAEWLTLDEIHDMAVRAYFKEYAA